MPNEEKNQENKKVTRKDIAELAGVSVSVVSRALNNSGYVKKEIKEKIIRLAREMNYYPNPVAMSLQQKRTRQILFYCKDMHNAFNIDMYHGMLKEAKKRNYMVLLNGNLNFISLREAMVDGIILQNEITAVEFDNACGKNYFLPAVLAGYGNYPYLSRSIPLVEWDTYSGMELAIEYLRKKGHTRIAYASPFSFEEKNCRTGAWKDLLKPVLGEELAHYHLGICRQDVPELDKLSDDTFSYESNQFDFEEEFFKKGIAAARLLLKRNLDATAVICFNDEFAFGIMQELQRHQIKIPDDISILSFDGSYRRRYVYPALTCVTCHPEKQGELLAEKLLDIIEGKHFHYITRIPSELLEGETVKNFQE